MTISFFSYSTDPTCLGVGCFQKQTASAARRHREWPVAPRPAAQAGLSGYSYGNIDSIV
jgi:hypothetical protein